MPSDTAADSYRAEAEAFDKRAQETHAAAAPLTDMSDGQNPALHNADKQELADKRHAAADRLLARWDEVFHKDHKDHKK